MHDETKLRLDAILFVRGLRERWVAVPASELRGFHIHLKGQSGIFKPAELSEPLSLTTTINSKHTQDVIEGSCVHYDYVSRDFDNEALKRCADAVLPLIYFLQVTRRPSPEYVVFAPAYVVGWDDESRRFLVDLSEQPPAKIAARATRQLGLFRRSSREVARSYTAGSVEQRLAAARFRNRVLGAGRGCAVCGLRERALLDAAPAGIPLCAIHHRALDAGILTIDEEGVVQIHLDRKGGEAERSMLLAFDGAKVRMPGS